MTQMLIAIGLWCGTPSHNRLMEHQVEQCQKKLLECVEKARTLSEENACFKEKKW